MSTFDHIKFGDGLTVTDEGAGVIRVDAGGGGGGGGDGIQFDTTPQEGGFLDVTTDDALLPVGWPMRGLNLRAHGGGSISLFSSWDDTLESIDGAGDIELGAASGHVDIWCESPVVGSGSSLNIYAIGNPTDGNINLWCDGDSSLIDIAVEGTASIINIFSEGELWLEGTEEVDLFSNGLIRIQSFGGPITLTGADVTLTVSASLKLLGLPTTSPGVTGAIWNDSGTVKIS